MCAAAASCIRGSPSRSRRPTASRWRTPRRRCSACATAATSRCASTWCACRPSRRSAQYLASGWIENVDDKSIEEFDINGLPTATALAKGDQWSFRLYAIRFGGEVYRFIFAAKQMTAEADRAFRYSVGTFRRMTQSEIDQARPLRLHVVTVQPGDTAERIAGRMPLVDRPLERFLIFNGLNHGRCAQGRREGEDRDGVRPARSVALLSPWNTLSITSRFPSYRY